MIGVDVLLFIERNGKNPNKKEVDNMLSSHEEFKKEMGDLADDPELSASRLSMYKMGKALNQKNLDYYNQFS